MEGMLGAERGLCFQESICGSWNKHKIQRRAVFLESVVRLTLPGSKLLMLSPTVSDYSTCSGDVQTTA